MNLNKIILTSSIELLNRSFYGITAEHNSMWNPNGNLSHGNEVPTGACFNGCILHSHWPKGHGLQNSYCAGACTFCTQYINRYKVNQFFYTAGSPSSRNCSICFCQRVQCTSRHIKHRVKRNASTHLEFKCAYGSTII